MIYAYATIEESMAIGRISLRNGKCLWKTLQNDLVRFQVRIWIRQAFLFCLTF